MYVYVETTDNSIFEVPQTFSLSRFNSETTTNPFLNSNYCVTDTAVEGFQILFP